MKNAKLINKITKTFYKTGFKLKKASPEILIITGVIGVVSSAVMACKATTKINDILEDAKETVNIIHEGAKAGAIKEVAYNADDEKKDLLVVYTQTAVKLVKVYAPSVILGTLSLTAILSSHNILRQRNMALAAAYATIDKGFKEYRSRVTERFGSEVDKELRYNIKAMEIETKTIDENGNEVITKEIVKVANPNDFSDFAKVFDEYCPGWTKGEDVKTGAEKNMRFLTAQQAFANTVLQKKGYLFLNEVYQMLGFEPTKAGFVVGWVYDDKHPTGDNYVDFGLYDISRPTVRDFINCRERSIILDFNVDGDILDHFA